MRYCESHGLVVGVVAVDERVRREQARLQFRGGHAGLHRAVGLLEAAHSGLGLRVEYAGYVLRVVSQFLKPRLKRLHGEAGVALTQRFVIAHGAVRVHAAAEDGARIVDGHAALRVDDQRLNFLLLLRRRRRDRGVGQGDVDAVIRLRVEQTFVDLRARSRPAPRKWRRAGR